MKNFLSIVVIVLLFIVSSLIFWAALSPKTFYKFFPQYRMITENKIPVGLIGTDGDKLLTATSSEPISSSKGQIIIKNNVWSVETALTEAEKARGLSNRQVLYFQKGMLFAFDHLDYQYFWMKDMLIPLDMIFFDDNWKIVLIEKNLQPESFPKNFGGKVKSKYVLEINAGEADSSGLVVGDQAIFINK